MERGSRDRRARSRCSNGVAVCRSTWALTRSARDDDDPGLRRHRRQGGTTRPRAHLAAPRSAAGACRSAALCTGAFSAGQGGAARRAPLHHPLGEPRRFDEEFPDIELTQTIFVVDKNRFTCRRRHGLGRPDAQPDRAPARDRAGQPGRRPDDLYLDPRGPRRAAPVDPHPDRRAPSQAGQGDPHDGDQHRGAGLARAAGRRRRHVHPPARAAVPPLSQPLPQALLHGAAAAEGPQPAACRPT